MDGELDRILPLVILRHPVDRAISVFEHQRRQIGVVPTDSKFTTLSRWLEWTITNEPSSVCDTQTVFLADGGTYYQAPDRLALTRAVDVLGGLPFCGVVNHYTESMVVLENMVRCWRPGFDAAFFPQNVSVGRHVSLEGRLEAIKREIGQSLFDHLWVNNVYDLELFDLAVSKLFNAVGAIDQAALQLQELRVRCNALR